MKVQLPCPVSCPVTYSMSSSMLDMAMSSLTLDMPHGMSSCTPCNWTCLDMQLDISVTIVQSLHSLGL
jgi:hypothetical protein